MADRLPTPETRQEVYLHDIATSLRTMSGRNVHPLHPDGTSELREPARKPAVCGETTQSGSSCRNSRPCRWHEAA